MLPIPGTLSLAHAKENLAALDLELSDEQLERLNTEGEAAPARPPTARPEP